MNAKPRRLIVPPQLEPVAIRLLKSALNAPATPGPVASGAGLKRS